MSNFDLGLAFKDWTRVFWTFVAGVLGYAAAAATNVVGGQPFDAKAFAIGALAAGVSLVKNFLLADTSAIK